MRTNTKALTTDPRFSPREDWGVLKFQNPREAHRASVEWARTPNEENWAGDEWIGLGQQTKSDFDASGIALKPRNLMKAAIANLVRKPTKAGKSAPALVGGAWNTPAVLAGLPLAAIARQRTKLPPLRIGLAISYSASVRDETLAPIFAKLSRAIWDYTLAGGSVDLTVYACGKLRRSSLGLKGLIVECRVPTQDIAQLSLGLSSVFFRAVAGPLMTAASCAEDDSIRIPDPSEIPLPPGTIFMGGRTHTGDIGASLDATLKALKIT